MGIDSSWTAWLICGGAALSLAMLARDPAPASAAQADATPADVLEDAPALVDVSAGQMDTLRPEVKLFTDRDYAVRELPEGLRDQPFVRAGLPGGVLAVCREAGAVVVLTPAPQYNSDSVSKDLADQGFRQVDVPLFQLFGESPASRCVAYHKAVTPGERFEFGKWGVLVARRGKVGRSLRTGYTPRRTSVITNHPIYTDDKPVAWPDVSRPKVESVLLYQPEHEWTYSHHPHLASFKGRFFAIWSNGHQDEDAPGQRVLLALSGDGLRWTEPRCLAVPGRTGKGEERVLTAGGFHQHEGTPVAYYGDYGPGHTDTRLRALTTTDGETWTAPREVGIPFCPNHGPQRTASGRLIFAGNMAFPYTDDPAGQSGWKMTGIYPPSMAGTADDPRAFWGVAAARKWPTALCEGSFYQTDDGVLHMLLRSTGEGFRYKLWVTESRDDGATWSEPAETAFTDANAKFHLGRLPDGRFYYVGNPLAGNRTPLVLSLSKDGASFDRHHILGETHYPMRRPGKWKGGEYGYPHTLVYGDHLYVIVSRQKEGVEVLRVALAAVGL